MSVIRDDGRSSFREALSLAIRTEESIHSICFGWAEALFESGDRTASQTLIEISSNSPRFTETRDRFYKRDGWRYLEEDEVQKAIKVALKMEDKCRFCAACQMS
jgi:hypothetical protein